MISILDFDNYQSFLKAYFEEKAKKNPSFSRRSFARVLGLSHSHLTRILQGSAHLSLPLGLKVAERLKLPLAELHYFELLVSLGLVKDEFLRQEILKIITKQHRHHHWSAVPVDAFSVIADWQYFSILALTKMSGFKSDPSWIGEKLGLKTEEAQSALERLISLGLVQEFSEGHLQVTAANLQTPHDVASAAAKENHRQQMRRAEAALQIQPLDLREFANLALTMSPESVGKAKDLIRTFIDNFNDEMESKNGSELFQLNIQFFQSSLS